MISKEEIMEIVNGYDPSKITIATVCSHSSLQIFHGARQEGFRTLGITIGQPPRFYDAFPQAKPDSFISLESYKSMLEESDRLIDENVIIVPHGSLVEYLGISRFEALPVPTFGNRRCLAWESDREMERDWLLRAGVNIPMRFERSDQIDRPVIVKYHGAKGGKGFFIAKNKDEFSGKIQEGQKYTIQEFILGTRYYLHFFYSPIREKGYRLKKGTLDMLGIDRRVESNADEIFRIGSVNELEAAGIYPSFVVTGNLPLVLRESLLTKVFELGERVVETSIELFGGMIGPFSLETIVTDDLDFKVFEISARIVAGTNLFISGSPYSDLIEKDLSTGRRIAQEVGLAREKDLFSAIVS
ncbi:MAG TPA: formate--phosphoribosylaminoimidazolecarboxamide ligase [Methanotrichaceae archaeon]|nr:formate--phosphoribosylaminoimidazolecarboxamide ligase [Methanotrichaceae archaeon]